MTKTAIQLASILVAATFSPTWVPSTHAAVLCQKPSGVVVVRSACKKKETPLDLAQFGAVGPKGDPGPTGSIEGAPAAGDLSGTYPAPTIAAAPAPTAVADNPRTATDPCAGPTPQSGIYCGTSTRHWQAPHDPSLPRITFWRDRLAAIHIAGAADLSVGNTILTSETLFYLPPDARPAKFQSLPIAATIGSGSPDPIAAVLTVRPDGVVKVEVLQSQMRDQVRLGDVEFRTDR